MRILFVGDIFDGSNAKSFAEGFSDAGHEVRTLDTSWMYSYHVLTRNPVRRLARRDPSDRHYRDVAAATTGWTPDVVFGFKAIYADPSILLSLPGIKLHYSPDDISNPINTTVRYLKAEREWHAIVTTKSYNVQELSARGVRNPIFVWSAYDERIHHDRYRRPTSQFEVGFIGAARRDRYDLPRFLSRIAPNQNLIVGPRWNRRYPLGWRGSVIEGPVSGSMFASAAARMRATLVLLNSENRDLHTCRSFEMAACRTAILAERTTEHEVLFSHGETALLHSSRDELESNIRRLRADSVLAGKLADAAHRALCDGRNTYRARAVEILKAIDS